MYCPTCGKSIPEESLFCLFCGKPVNKNESSSITESVLNRIVPTDKPPKIIKVASIVYLGPVNSKNGTKKYGFKFLFSLNDEQDKPTRAVGHALLTIDDRSIFSNHKLFYEYDFTKNGFEQITLSDFFGHKNDYLCYSFIKMEPILNYYEDYFSKITLTFLDGQKLSNDTGWQKIY